jgi:hypothetical protein
MTDQGKELQALLRQWEAPEPGQSLDARVMRSWGQARPRPRIRTWLGIAAVILIFLGFAQSWIAPETSQQSTRLATTMDAQGFRPLPDGNITITTLTKGSKQ